MGTARHSMRYGTGAGSVALVVVALCGKAATAGVPAISVVEAPGVTCPSAEAVQAALGRVRGGPAAAAATFRLFVDQTADQVHVDLRDDANRSVLAREIPLAATDCEQAAQAIALMVERHFRAVEWSPGGGGGGAATPSLPAAPATMGGRAAPGLPTSPPALPAVSPTPSLSLAALPPTAPAATPVPANAPTRPVSPVAPAAQPLPAFPSSVTATAATTAPPEAHPALLHFDPAVLPRFALGAGPAFWSRADTFAIAVAARWRVTAAGPIEVGAGVLLPPLHSSTAVGSMGSVHVGAVPVSASVGLTEALGKLALAAHLGVLWTIERGESESIPAPATAWRTVLGFGLGTTAAWPLSPRLRITGSLDGYRTVLGRSYAVSGVQGSVLDPAPWQVIGVLGAEWVVVP